MTTENETERLETIKRHNETKIAQFNADMIELYCKLEDTYDQKEDKDDYFFYETYDPIDTQQIHVEYYFNNWEVIRFRVTIKDFSRDNDEIVTSDSVGCVWDSYDPNWEGDCNIEDTYCEECKEFKTCEVQYATELRKVLNQEEQEEIINIMNSPEKTISLFGVDLTYKRVVEEFICFNNITHYHTVKGDSLEITFQDADLILPIIECRDILMRLCYFIDWTKEF